jgi:hypothetical protein
MKDCELYVIAIGKCSWKVFILLFLY